ncbi:hypothetical protein AQUCO_03400076v1 [Aquilegia coerulea]|uniref:Rapid alkalinization factor 1 n=1 Tax=Aquilegia coerulea TaxID=218851 RepID=A0A2G5CXD2_AQUCA|nr:hypothetical protein AQUCO_03400076v1 [Aquilegia coerulea]
MLMKSFFLALLFQIILSTCNGVHVMDTTTTSFQHNEMEVMVKKACTGKMGLCFWETKKVVEDDIEVEMDSEINRRVLYEQKKYISYETLKRDVVPCDRPGAPYYDCHHMGQANPYSRGCEVITRCRGNR